MNKVLKDSEVNADNLEQSKQVVIKNNYWNHDHEKILLLLHNYSNRLYKHYHDAYITYKRRLQWYRIPIIIMSSLSGFLSISNSGYIPADYNKWVSLLVGFSNLMVTVISLIENFKKIDSNTNKAYIAYLNFKKLNNELSLVLRIPANERDDNGNGCVNMFFVKFESYINEAPVLNKEVSDYLEFIDVKNKFSQITNSVLKNIMGSDIESNFNIDEELAKSLKNVKSIKKMDFENIDIIEDKV